ncbi:MAG TPA: hypothetical protein VLA72_05370, partial [Anaerolineales bacterium]|nr:hypothetical protein [Anaerolineales bacterium]
DRSGVADFTFTLNKLSLLQWSNWPQKSKSYLDAADEKIDIVDLVDDYYKQINDFHEWLHKRLKEVHAKELVWLEEMKKNILNEMSDEEKRDRGLI